MKKHIAVWLTILAVICSVSTYAQVKMSECIFLPEDKQIIEQKLSQFAGDSGMSMPDLLIKIGLSFQGTPYVAATLENGLAERLVINARQLDCTTFVETTLALARTVKLKKQDFQSYADELEKLRYRNGKRDQYPSRLHYFCEWIDSNEQKHIVSGVPNKNGVKLDKTINYMSTHPADYPVLKEFPALIPAIAEQEKKLSAKGFMYFQKNDIANLYKNLQNGDIIALTSTIDGVDVNHVGIILKKENEFYLLHAPLSGKKVLVSDGPITDFLKPASKNSGIMIARPVF